MGSFSLRRCLPHVRAGVVSGVVLIGGVVSGVFVSDAGAQVGEVVGGLDEVSRFFGEGEAGPMGAPTLFPPSSPFQNPPSEAKRVLGKILFWDEQLSSDNTVSCGTCHIPSSGGADPRIGVNPGFDQLFSTADDVIGSPGVISMDVNDEYAPSGLFGLGPQATGRVAQTNLMAMFNGNLFWDGRAELNFVDPETGVLLFQSGVAGLEIQASAPILSEVEMSHAGRTWDQVRDKLGRVRPMALGDSVPADMLAAIQSNPSYGELFEEAFGDPLIDAVRISFALATYQRTLVPDESPYDLWAAGDEGAMTVSQKAGFSLYVNSTCSFCHMPPTFANSDFFVDGVRPVFEDVGRMGVTGLNSDRGKFRTPTIRNVGLRNRLMHTGGLGDIDDIFDFYGRRNGLGPFPENLSGFLSSPILFSPTGEIAVKDFLVNGLEDPRVANETFPFDRPGLYAERAQANPLVLGGGDLGSGGFAPVMVAAAPPNLGNDDFKIGVDFGLGGALAWVAVSSSPPVDGVVAMDELLGPVTLGGMGNGTGFGTMVYPIADNPALDGQRLYMQWVISDPAGGAGGVGGGDGFIRSGAARVDVFCSAAVPCTVACVGDFNGDGLSDFFDISAFIGAYSAQSSAADVTGDGLFNFFDVSAFLEAFGAGCP